MYSHTIKINLWENKAKKKKLWPFERVSYIMAVVFSDYDLCTLTLIQNIFFCRLPVLDNIYGNEVQAYYFHSHKKFWAKGIKKWF